MRYPPDIKQGLQNYTKWTYDILEKTHLMFPICTCHTILYFMFSFPFMLTCSVLALDIIIQRNIQVVKVPRIIRHVSMSIVVWTELAMTSVSECVCVDPEPAEGWRVTWAFCTFTMCRDLFKATSSVPHYNSVQPPMPRRTSTSHPAVADDGILTFWPFLIPEWTRAMYDTVGNSLLQSTSICLVMLKLHFLPYEQERYWEESTVAMIENNFAPSKNRLCMYTLNAHRLY